MTDVLADMRRAVEAAVGAKWPALRGLAETEFKKLTVTGEHIVAQAAAGTITQQEAAVLIDMQKTAARAVFLGIEGIGLVMAQNAANAAIAVLTTFITRATGFPL